jgi:sulfoacetaldehyde dehydrogenase
VEGIADALLAALEQQGGRRLDAAEAATLQRAMFPGGKLSQAFVAKDAATIAQRAGLARAALADARFLIVDEAGVGRDHPFSGEKLSPVLAFYREPDFTAARARATALLHHQGAGHSVGLHTRSEDRAVALGLALPVCRVIVNQAHCFATGGSYDNALPFSLSMGCGTWGGNSISDNLGYRHFLNITRIVRPFAPERVREPTEDELFARYRTKHGV